MIEKVIAALVAKREQFARLEADADQMNLRSACMLWHDQGAAFDKAIQMVRGIANEPAPRKGSYLPANHPKHPSNVANN